MRLLNLQSRNNVLRSGVDNMRMRHNKRINNKSTFDPALIVYLFYLLKRLFLPKNAKNGSRRQLFQMRRKIQKIMYLLQQLKVIFSIWSKIQSFLKKLSQVISIFCIIIMNCHLKKNLLKWQKHTTSDSFFERLYVFWLLLRKCKKIDTSYNSFTSNTK